MPTTPAITKDLPLPARIFHAAMEQQLSLADYAQRLGISSESLRAVVMAQLNHVEPAILDHLADLYHQSPDALREQLSIAPPQESFANWLKHNMEGISQHALRGRVQVDAKTLKRFLNAELLPDSDQAERIARALYIDRRELARVVAANMVHQADVEGVADTASTTAEPATVRPRRIRPQNAPSNAEPANAEAAAAIGAALVEPALEGTRLRRAASRRQAGTKMVDAPKEPLIGPEADMPRRPAARHKTGAKTAAPPSAAAADSETLPAFNAPNQHITRKQRRAEPVSKQGSADAAPPVIVPREVVAPASEVAIELDPASDTARIATAAPTAVAQLTRLAMATDGAVPRTPPSDVRGPALPTSDATATPTTAAITPANRLRPAPPSASTTIAPSPAPAAVTSVVAADTTTLQLTADEVRLIRHWRQLHPQGRRATLHYIGSLLVED
jgi:transcriptional regulator with XRE-family HTH domain